MLARFVLSAVATLLPEEPGLVSSDIRFKVLGVERRVYIMSLGAYRRSSIQRGASRDSQPENATAFIHEAHGSGHDFTGNF